ncbi:MAG: hypothetical protein KGL58_01995 [Pseudomonadota bacterium]|nr:hypothetical protein [Pseudomonadota bacterium]
MTSSEKSEKKEMNVALLLGVFFSLLVLMGSVVHLSATFEPQLTQIALTRQGCTFLESLDLPVRNLNGQCSITEPYQEYSFSSGGTIVTAGGKFIELEGAQVVGTVPVHGKKLPMTPEQKHTIGFTVAAFLVFGIAVILFLRSLP